ncbi:4Fe-4S binding protein [Pseudodesulfovibrio sp.]|uniref:4Fe-4S binding protein n=1 Tax=unclassified Pseudodesulfovibrio TaxID=2661612 RepID=UPI003B008E01
MQKLTPIRFRLLVQSVFALFCLYVGFRFAAFLAWAGGRSDTFVPRPGAVEGFLPISALLGLRQWLGAGVWDHIHPAGLTILLALIVMAFLFRKGFCGYICPVGFLSSLLDRAGRRIGLAKVPPRKLDLALTGVKYIGLGFFLFTVFFGMDLRSVQAFLNARYNMVADARMMQFFLQPSGLALIVLGVLIVLTVLIRNFWCRYLCPYGAFLGLFSWFSPTAVVRDEKACVHCGKCTRGCPAGIVVESKRAVRTPECIGCAECVGNCPVDDCLSVKMMGRVRMPWWAIGVGAVAVLLLFWAWGIATGHWNADVPPDMLRRIYAMVAA